MDILTCGTYFSETTQNLGASYLLKKYYHSNRNKRLIFKDEKEVPLEKTIVKFLTNTHRQAYGFSPIAIER